MGGLGGGFVNLHQQQGKGDWFNLGEEELGGGYRNGHSSCDSAEEGKLVSL